MSFAAGFLDQWNKIDDRKLKMQMLNKELAERRRENLMKLAANKQTRDKSTTSEQAALMWFNNRIKNDPSVDPEEGAAWLNTMAKTGKLSEAMGAIIQIESRDDTGTMMFTGKRIIDNITPILPEEASEQGDVMFNLSEEDMSDEALLNNERYEANLRGAANQPQAMPNTGTFDITRPVTVDQGVFDNFEKAVGTGVQTFLSDSYEYMPDDVKEKSVVWQNDLGSSNLAVRNKAFNEILSYQLNDGKTIGSYVIPQVADQLPQFREAASRLDKYNTYLK